MTSLIQIRRPGRAGTRLNATPSHLGVVHRQCACGRKAGPTGECEECRRKRLAGVVQRVADGRATGRSGQIEAPPIVHEVLRSPGRPLDGAARTDMESRFGHDFSAVRVHRGPRAAESARAVGALAYAVGQDLVFGAGQYAPDTAAGRHLLAHELQHTRQQAPRTGPAPLTIGDASGPEERECDAVAAAVVRGGLGPPVPPPPAVPGAKLRRKISPELAHIEDVLRARGLFSRSLSTDETHQLVLLFKAMSDADLRDTVRALETRSPDYIERFLTHIGENDQRQELATLRRIKSARVFTVESKTGERAVTTEVVGSCSPQQFQTIYRASATAIAWLNRAIADIDAFLAAPGAPGNYDTATALNLHFHSKAPEVARHIRGRLARIRADITSARQFSIECHGVWDPECRDAGAYTDTNAGLVVFCNSFFGNDPVWQAESVVHEMAHAQVGGLDVTDRAYRADRALRFLTPAEALTNAESFGLLVQQLGTGRSVRSTAPADKTDDCPPAWSRLLRKAVATAQRWNRNLQVTLGIITPAAIRPPSSWARHLGGATQGNIDAAKQATDRVASKLESPVKFECEPDGGGRCDRGTTTYWYFIGHLHVCPAWPALAGEDARVQSLLAGLYGYIGDVDDDSRRNNYAQLAAENNARWAAPTLPRVLGGTRWNPEYIHIEVTPRLPPMAKRYYSVDGTSDDKMSADAPILHLTPPPPMMLESNLRFDVAYFVDYTGDQGRPLPFTAPELRAACTFASPAENFSRTYSDLRPVYRGADVPLATRIPGTFEFTIRDNGPFHLRLELQDPDAKITRVYDDTLQLQATTPSGKPKP